MPAKIQRIYTDGACSGNPGPGGWGTLICFEDGEAHELGGGERQTTNNRMEMQAAIAGLEFLISTGQTTPVSLYTDSEYVLKGITQWIKGWKKRGWVNSAKKPVLNRDLWEILDTLTIQVNQQLERPLEWLYVRGHTGDPGNERCDAIARAFAAGRAIKLLEQV
ncbi:ribonuclease HI [Pseudanabaena sp. FACHB-2040]|uniref:ribonuclease HI n=1 Tax=Pseudanabaena sp. FACHB-2040 TaxID=2692859 RepID=UPI001682609D|nr:ribonuclease HI [Pseudanabaena sp. FACHB-2040]MBD0268756.1 ribonuclease HI [Cyanobacteria bacterium Co-bin8]MBD2260855.1 ribonuclease HI [Pseudanabaena sp. FACHB-2040]